MSGAPDHPGRDAGYPAELGDGHAVPARFGDLVRDRVLARESQIVLGLDPDPGTLWPEALAAAPRDGGPAERLAAAFLAQGRALIAAAGPACVAVKPQLACFERLGAPGWSALAALVAEARGAGLLVIADAKRGDISISAAAYAQALLGFADTPFGRVQGLDADAATVNPLMGHDALEPFLAWSTDSGRGAFALVRTSNPSADEVQDLELAAGGRVWERIAELVAREGAALVGTSGLSALGAVVGATASGHLVRMRELMPNSIFLLPGVGAQGGRVEDLAPAFAPGPAGGLVSSSRAIADAHVSRGGSPRAAARAEAERLRGLAWGLA